MQSDSDEVNAPVKTKAQLLQNIRVALAGRVSEIVHFGVEDGMSSGVLGDLKQATQIAKYMLLHCGMDDEFLMCYINEDALDAKMSTMLYTRISKLLREQMALTIRDIEEGYQKVQSLTEALIQHTSLTSSQIKDILK